MSNSNYAGKSVLITGANGGLGKETVKWLIEDGFGRIVMGSRDEQRGRAARDEVLEATGAGREVDVTAVGGFDMTDPAKIEAAIASLPADQPFDVVFLQAGGVVFTKDYDTVEYRGRTVERTVFQNVIGGHITLAALRKRGLVAPNARVIFAGGEGARGIPGLIEAPHYDSPNALRQYVHAQLPEPHKYNPMNAIGASKFMGALWTRKLAELEGPNMSVVWFSPGLTYGTAGLAAKPPVQRWFLEKVVFGVMRLLGKAQSPRDGARKYADAIEGKVGQSGDVIGAPEGGALGKLTDQLPMNPDLQDPALREAFWGVLEEVYPYPA